MPSAASEEPPAANSPRWTIWHLLVLLPWIVALAPVGLPFRDNSYLWHVRAGDAQAAAGAVLTTDPFTFTSGGEPWRTQSWLAELGYSQLDSWFGLAGASWMAAGGALLLFGFVALGTYRASRSVPVMAIAGIATAVLLSVLVNPRPALFGFIGMAALVLVEGDRKLRWTMPLLMWMWASVHASFALGLVYIVARSLQARRFGKVAPEIGVAAAASLLGAHGLAVIGFLLDFASDRDALAYLSEWRFPNPLEAPYFVLVFGIGALVAALVSRRITWRDWWVIGPFLVLAFTSRRAVPFGWIPLLPLLVRHPNIRILHRPFPTVPLVLAAVVIAGTPFLVGGVGGVAADRFPVEAATHLSHERVFHDDIVGGWLVYTQWPERRVYIDDRAELHGGSGFRALLMAERGGASALDILEQEGVAEALLNLARAPGLAETLKDADWREKYRDEYFVVFERMP